MNGTYRLDIGRDDPHLRGLDGSEVEMYEKFGDDCYLVWVDGERVLVAGHEVVNEDGEPL